MRALRTTMKRVARVSVAAIFSVFAASDVDAAPFAYVAGGPDTVTVIDVATNAVVSTISTAGSMRRVAATPDGTRVYVSNSTNPGTVTVIATSTNSVLGPAITVGNGPEGIAVGAGGAFVY